MAKPLIVVCGAGLIGGRHVDQALTQARLGAIVDPSDAAKARAAKLCVPHFDRVEACLERMRPDGVVIATPNQMHADHAMICIDAGLPMLIEKPLADTRANADRIVVSSEAAGIPVLVGHHRRHNPIIARAKATIDAGDLGDIVAAHGQFWLYKPDDYFNATWRNAPGAGPTMINFIHDVDLMRYLVGHIADVQSMRSTVQRKAAVEDTAAIMMRFSNGALGTFTVSDTIAAPWSWEMSSGENPIYPHKGGSCYSIGGTHGSLSIPDLMLWAHDDKRSWWEPISARTLEVNPADAFALQFAHFLDVIGGAVPLVSAREGRDSLVATLQVLDAPLKGRTS